MICVGGIDAIPRMKYKWKASLMAMMALINTKYAIEFQLSKPPELDLVVDVEATGGQISFHSLLSSVYGMLAMFLWKQAIDVIRNKDCCISITYRPYLQWVTAETRKSEAERSNDFNAISS